ncbi:hypothetical protein [Burkholderia metallica]|uniref:hypothetical protein n=1 Tax=Burkholderia metallica TaxID=488729 RepID=UPI001CF5611F|nr:hypothetical protein [Burkholderia metallica]MCA8018085.1 hypothetical protein [Burkholderia metallica]
MSWPKGRPRPKKVGASAAAEQEAIEAAELAEMVDVPREPDQPPADWRKGALLNVRNRGDAYVITLYPEEFSDEHPERAMRFTNLGECQDFVSKWYAAEHHDPRAR